jgi:hypothetical protein
MIGRFVLKNCIKLRFRILIFFKYKLDVIIILNLFQSQKRVYFLHHPHIVGIIEGNFALECYNQLQLYQEVHQYQLCQYL